jgi:hypothetical protein
MQLPIGVNNDLLLEYVLIIFKSLVLLFDFSLRFIHISTKISIS